MKKIVFFISILFSLLGIIRAEIKPETDKPLQNAFYGTVRDKITGEPLAGAKVVIEGLNQVVYTDFDGEFVFTNLLPGSYKVNCSFQTYEVYSIGEITIDKLYTVRKLEIPLVPVTEKPSVFKKKLYMSNMHSLNLG